MDIDQALRNWRRWLLLKDWMPPRYKTILGQLYRSPQCWHPKELRIQIDILQAQDVETALHLLPDQYQKIIILQYIGQHQNGARVIRNITRLERYRIAALPERTYYRHLHAAKDHLKYILTSGKNKRKSLQNTIGCSHIPKRINI